MGWSVVGGALAAALVGWVAIAGFAWVGRNHLALAPLRVFGGLSLAAVALALGGLPVPWVLPVGLLAVGLVAGFAWPHGNVD